MVVRKVSELGELSAAERQVIAELDTGEDIELGDGTRPETDSDERGVRAALIRLLLLGDDADPQYRLHEKGIQLSGAWVRDCLDLEGCRDLRDVVLLNCHFTDAPLLRSAELRNLFLNGSSLPGLSADRLEVNGGVFLRGVEATGEVRLLGAKIGGNLSCVGAKFRAVTDGEGLKGWALNLDGVRVDGALLLRNGAEVDGVLDLTAAQVGDLNDEEGSWPEPGLLLLNRFQYGAITAGPVDARCRLDWLGRQDPARWGADFWPQPYEELAKVLREMGHGDEAKTVLIAKERVRRQVELGRLPGWRRPFYWGFTQLLRMVGYGYRPALALIPAALVVLLGWAVVHNSTRAGLLVPAAPAQAGAPAPVLIPLAYSFEAFVPIVKLGQAEAFRPDLRTRWGYWLQVYLWIHGFLGWLIGGIAVAGVLGLFRRE